MEGLDDDLIEHVDQLHQQEEEGIVVDQQEGGVEDQHSDISDGFEVIAGADLEEYLLPVGAVPVDVSEADLRSSPDHNKTYHTLTSVSSMEQSYNDPAGSDDPDQQVETWEELHESILGASVQLVTQEQLQHSMLVASGQPVTHAVDHIPFENVDIPDHLQSTPKKCTPEPR